jgi:hypothetical protein
VPSELLALIVALVLAGVVQGAFIACDWLPGLAVPLDGGAYVRGHRIFGDNKTVRGALVMILATAVAAGVLFSMVPPFSPEPSFGWPALGALMGFAYIVAELPNSFVKRQLDIAPGAETTGAGRWVQYVADQSDSVIGVVILIGLVTDLPGDQLVGLAVVGAATHALFDVGLHRVGVKGRAKRPGPRAPRA